MRYITIVAALLTLLVAGAQNTESALDRRYQEALSCLHNDSTRDERKAVAIFEELAAKGYEEAQYEVAALYVTGDSEFIAQDCKRGVAMMKALADKGNVKASGDYAIMLREGVCVEADTLLSIKYEQFAADHGHLQSMHNIGVALRDGRYGMRPDTISAIGWFRRAAEKDYAPAQWQLSRYYHGSGNEEEARYWLKRGAENGDVYCLHGVGLSYKNGNDGFQKDEDEALRYFLRCVEEFDFLESRIAAAEIYHARKDKTALRKILLPAVDRNDPEAMLMLMYGESYMDEDDNIVFEYYKKLSDMPVASVREDARWVMFWAYFKLGVSYYLGRGCTQDRRKGAVILYQMADNGLSMAIDAIRNLNIPRP